jgi:hypothetical protein
MLSIEKNILQYHKLVRIVCSDLVYHIDVIRMKHG